ncbi:DUF4432 family protein [Aneurinibacillus tyrosinisolvens]|uniref:DUF4432 family protein n=1 Tax=Aneurinibacillus tyrosinisolvens TaxID=1443435 RepID=UPI00069C6451|nr:DUF4432 family protein [Aneurinibacillus tyrosinisolvens]
MDHYHGGWQELFPSGSGPGFYQGAYLGYHGEVASCAWDYRILVDEPEVIEVLLTVKTLRTPFLLEKKIRLESGKSIIYLQEKITNYGKKGMHFMWGHHPSFGAPFLSEECTLALPPCKIIPLQKPGDNSRLSKAEEFDWPLGIDREGNQVDLRQIRGSEAACSDMLFATSYKEGWYALTNHRMGLGVGMVWPVEDFPHLWIWQDFGGTADYPWYGNAYTMAVEPFTSRVDRGDDGLNEAIRNGTAAWIGAGEETAKELKVVSTKQHVK